MFDYTAIADRLRTVSWGNDSQPNDMVKRFMGTKTSRKSQKLSNQRDTYI